MQKKFTALIFSLLTLTSTCSANNYYFDDECGMFFGGDFLYWTACQKGLDYTTTLAPIVDEEGAEPYVGYVRKYLDHNWAPGFRAHIGYRNGTNCMALRTTFTYWYNDSKEKFKVLIEFDEEAQLENSISYRGKATIDYRTVDLLLERPSDFSCTGEMRPFVGFRALWLDETFKTHAKMRVIVGEEGNKEELIIRTDPVVSRSELCAFGINGGVEYRFDICNGFTVWESVSASLLEGDIQAHREFIDPCERLQTTKHNSPIPGYSIGAGLGWETCYCLCGSYMKARLDLGYEFNHWFCIAEELRDRQEKNRIDLDSTVFQGATLKASLFF